MNNLQKLTTRQYVKQALTHFKELVAFQTTISDHNAIKLKLKEFVSFQATICPQCNKTKT